MARPNERKNFDRRENNSEGHDVKWDLSVRDLLHLRSWAFKKTYRTLCKISPTEWRFEMQLPEVRDDGACSLKVLLERTDSLNVELEASIWIDFRDTSKNLIFPKQTFTKSGMLPGDSIQETVQITPRPNMRDAIHRDAVVFVVIMISLCHSDE
ncbi:hypothetical protein AVEN_184292-1 [Araneus ventricosus]|uniref:Uncharacterized protein n=1 Tax=Araneus ventricosus TaxID=182803 RepID=A0A4Y2KCG0_ARAVE|nr:hypothetical protein AVEN_184292-1 [Araneus ventricosus]